MSQGWRSSVVESVGVWRRHPLETVTVAYLLGQGSAALGWTVASQGWIAGALISGGLVVVCGSRRVGIAAFCLLTTFFIANWTLQRVLHPHLPANHARNLTLPRDVTIDAWVFREPDRLPHRGRLYLKTLQLWQQDGPHPASGAILLTVRSLNGDWRYGDRLRLTLRLRSPRNFHTPGSFDYESYLARQEIYVSAFLWDDHDIHRVGWHGNWFRARIEHLRREIGAFFSSHLDEQTAAVLRALIVGDEGGLTKELRTAFSRAGVTHVLSISGLHISLVAAASYGAWWWLLGRSRYLLLTFVMPKLAAGLTILPVLLYAGLSGGNVATWRSVVMVLVYLFAILCDRQEEVYRSLALAALLISLLWPGAVLDISFQLSFVSVLSILLGMGRFTTRWDHWREHWLPQLSGWQERLGRWVAVCVLVSFCTLLATAPLTAFHFHQVAVIGVFANLLIIPLLGAAAVLGGLLAAALFFLHPSLATPILFGAGLVTKVGVWLTQEIGAWSFAAFYVVTPTLVELLLLYGCCACWLWARTTIQTGFARVAHLLVFAGLVGLLFDSLLWVQDRYFRRDVRVSFLDVGQGDAAVVELPGSQVMVIDGGGFASEEFDAGEAILAPFLWSRKIAHVDILVMSHPQLDHYGGLAFIAEHFSPQELWFNGEQSTSPRFTRLWTALTRNGTTLRTLCRETSPISLSPRDTVYAQILNPPCHTVGLDTNNASLVVRLSHGTIDFLFTGDVEAEGEQQVLTGSSAVASEILKAPHHGSRTSSTAAFVRAVLPQLVVASLGFHNRFKFPAQEVVQRYEKNHSQFLRTDLHGTITIVSDGARFTVQTTTPPAGFP
jgi:competence protein ComEC